MTNAIDPAQNAMTAVAPPAESHTRACSLRSSIAYCLTLVLLPLFAIPALIALGSSDFFLHHGASVWVQANDKVFDAHDRDCDVVVYGDSTAMTGIDPDRVEEQTGLKTCNIAVTNAVLAVTGNLTLDHFLANNRHPRVLLVQLSPNGFQPDSAVWQHTVYAEGLLELLRHGKPGEARHVLMTHPTEAVSFAGYAAGFTAWYAIKDLWFHATALRPREDLVTVRNGFFTPPFPPRTSCEVVGTAAAPEKSDQTGFSRLVVQDFRTAYADRAGVVLVNVAPIPDCDRNVATYTAALDGVTSNSLLTLPVNDFNNCCHYTAHGSEIVSSLVAQELKTVASTNPAFGGRVSPNRQVASLHRIRLRIRR